MTAIAKVGQGEIQHYDDGLLAVIERAARDPNVDIVKMEKLLDMQERVHARNAKAAYADALATMQPMLPVISERGKILKKTGGTQSTYARWEDVNEAIRPLLAENGFALSFKTGRASNGEVEVTGILSHRAGHSEETMIALPIDDSGSKNAVQAIGSSTSYGKRYTAFALLNITSKGEDDDGGAGGGQPINRFDDPPQDGPASREKLDGPYTSKTALQAALRTYALKLGECMTSDAMMELQTGYAATIEQARRYIPKWLDGDPENPDSQGLIALAINRKALIDLLDDMRTCETQTAMDQWVKANGDSVDGLTDADRRTFEAEWAAHGSARLMVAGMTA